MSPFTAAWGAFAVAFALASGWSLAHAPDRTLSDDERVARAIVRIRMDAADRAFDDLAAVLDRDPRHARAHYAAALAAAQVGQPDAAIQHIRAYLAIAPNAPDAAEARATLEALERRKR